MSLSGGADGGGRGRRSTRPPPRGANCRRRAACSTTCGARRGVGPETASRALPGGVRRRPGARDRRLLSAAPRVVESDVGFGVAPANATTLPWVVHTPCGRSARGSAPPPPKARGASAGGSGRRAEGAAAPRCGGGRGEGAAWAGLPPSAPRPPPRVPSRLPRAEVVAELEALRSHPWRTGSSTPPAPPDGGLSSKLGGRTTPPPKPFGTATPPKPSGGLFGRRRPPPHQTPSVVGHGVGAAPSHGLAGGAQSVRRRHCHRRRAARAGARRRKPSVRLCCGCTVARAGAHWRLAQPVCGVRRRNGGSAAAAAAGSPVTFTASNPASPMAAAAPAPAGAFTFTSSHSTSPAALAAAGRRRRRARRRRRLLSQLDMRTAERAGRPFAGRLAPG